uniref:Putative secreted protein synganglion overexpressed n=1 Tax=Rhipicephalus microplus TaxID=6941 RepID=A0A6M2DAD8_RHIMP
MLYPAYLAAAAAVLAKHLPKQAHPRCIDITWCVFRCSTLHNSFQCISLKNDCIKRLHLSRFELANQKALSCLCWTFFFLFSPIVTTP